MKVDWRPGTRFTDSDPVSGWTGIWVPHVGDEELAHWKLLVLRRGDKYFITKPQICPTSEDIGPYDSLEDAGTAAEVLLVLNEIPWKKG